MIGVSSGLLSGKPRVSAVSYLNTCPLTWGLQHGPQQGAFELRFELPAACAQSLASGAADFGLVPVIEAFRQNLTIAADLCISSDGPVRSIFLLHRKPLRQVASVALDSSSRTSVALTKILLAERYGIRPREREMPPDAAAMLASADAALLIGDPALRLNLDTPDFEVVDLGSEWQLLTQLPMVYAVWAGPGPRAAEIADLFLDSYRFGRAQIEEIIEREAPKRQIAFALAREYLTSHIGYELTARALKGMQEFKRLARIHTAGTA